MKVGETVLEFNPVLLDSYPVKVTTVSGNYVRVDSGRAYDLVGDRYILRDREVYKGDKFTIFAKTS